MNRRLFSLGIPGTALFASAANAQQGAASHTPDSFRAALIETNPELSKFNPLRRILFYDDFDNGHNGWCELQANHNGNLDELRPALRDMRPPQISNCGFFDIGTHGSVNGTYALKIATRPKPFHTATAIKRMTFAKPGPVQVEMWFTFKPEQTFDFDRPWDGNVSPTQLDFGDFTISNDICGSDGGPRFMCALRYWNTDLDNKLAEKWSYKTSLHTTTKMDRAGARAPSQALDYQVQDIHDWSDIPGGRQPLCYNEVATKINWHYLRWVFDTRARRNTALQVNDLILDLAKVPVLTYPDTYRAESHLMNFVLDVRTHKPVRNFLFVDSVLVSLGE
ncbi:MAG TPA: DUF6772 family protein [Bryobacteraceae bacterium]|jgi:hypothetical protein